MANSPFPFVVKNFELLSNLTQEVKLTSDILPIEV